MLQIVHTVPARFGSRLSGWGTHKARQQRSKLRGRERFDDQRPVPEFLRNGVVLKPCQEAEGYVLGSKTLRQRDAGLVP